MPFLNHTPPGVRFLVAGLAAMVAVPAVAADDSELVVSQPMGEVRTVEVRIDDLDLSSAYDRETLNIRIRKASAYVCDIQQGSMLDRLPDARACVNEARAGAEAQLSQQVAASSYGGEAEQLSSGG